MYFTRVKYIHNASALFSQMVIRSVYNIQHASLFFLYFSFILVYGYKHFLCGSIFTKEFQNQKESHGYRRQHNYKGQLDKTYNLQKPAGFLNKIFISLTVGHQKRG